MAKPVTIVTGFLGAGKTTFINQMINKYKDTRFCIIENEFGKVGIDKELLVSYQDTSIFQLANGCLCCNLNNDLIDLLAKLISISDKFDHIIIETTGIAEPEGIARTFLIEPQIQEYFKLNGCICVVDGNHYDDKKTSFLLLTTKLLLYLLKMTSLV